MTRDDARFEPRLPVPWGGVAVVAVGLAALAVACSTLSGCSSPRPVRLSHNSGGATTRPIGYVVTMSDGSEVTFDDHTGEPVASRSPSR